METSTPRRQRPWDRMIPLWDVGRPRPVGNERRKDTGALDRHAQAATGTAPSELVQRRQPPKPQRERAVRLWLETDNADHEPRPGSVVRAA